MRRVSSRNIYFLLLCLCLLIFCGCGKKQVETTTEEMTTEEPVTTEALETVALKDAADTDETYPQAHCCPYTLHNQYLHLPAASSDM